MKKTIRDSFFYTPFGIEGYLNNIQKLDVNKAVIGGVRLENILNEIKFKINFSSKQYILPLLSSGRMVFINEPNLFLPAWSQVSKAGEVDRTVVNLFGKVKFKDFDGINFAPREVFGMAQIGYFLSKFYENEAKIVNSQHILNNSVEVYMRMVFRVLDILYSVDASPSNGAVCRFLINKFFLIHVYEKENSATVDELAFRPLKSIDNLSRIKAAIGSENPEMFTSLSAFISSLGTYIYTLKDLDISAFSRKVILLYGEKAFLMLENLNYFLAIVSSSTIGTGYVKDYILEGLLGKEAINIYNNFIDLTR